MPSVALRLAVQAITWYSKLLSQDVLQDHAGSINASFEDGLQIQKSSLLFLRFVKSHASLRWACNDASNFEPLPSLPNRPNSIDQQGWFTKEHEG